MHETCISRSCACCGFGDVMCDRVCEVSYELRSLDYHAVASEMSAQTQKKIPFVSSSRECDVMRLMLMSVVQCRGEVNYLHHLRRRIWDPNSPQ